jgi:hypothetical protein
MEVESHESLRVVGYMSTSLETTSSEKRRRVERRWIITCVYLLQTWQCSSQVHLHISVPWTPTAAASQVAGSRSSPGEHEIGEPQGKTNEEATMATTRERVVGYFYSCVI